MAAGALVATLSAAAVARRTGRRVQALEAELAAAEADQRGELETLTLEYERVLTALENMADGILIVDARLRVERVNPAAVRLLRLADGVIGRSLAAVVRDHEVVSVLADALEANAPRTADVRLAPAPRPDGGGRDEVRIVRVTGIPLTVGGDETGGHAGLVVLQDLTELRRAESARREFVANVSHELRTPLAAIKAIAETLEEGALEDPPAAREFLSQMHVEIDSLAELVQELLELSRIESGQVTLRREAVAPRALLRDAEHRLRRQAARLGVEVNVDAPDRLPDVWVDPPMIERVALNLLHNALKFTPAGGRVRLGAAIHADGVALSVTDSGVGIAPDDLDRIFERFYKVDRSRASGGTGLGLAIVKHTVQAHGGRVWAESRGEGTGATFWLTLPTVPDATEGED